jgi:hypothetical protein
MKGMWVGKQAGGCGQAGGAAQAVAASSRPLRA